MNTGKDITSFITSMSSRLLKIMIGWCINKMLNILKVAGLFQSVPSFTSRQDKNIPQYQAVPTQTNMMSDFFSGRSSNNQGSSKKDVKKGASGLEDKEANKKGNNKKDDNDDNNSGGLLEPII